MYLLFVNHLLIHIRLKQVTAIITSCEQACVKHVYSIY